MGMVKERKEIMEQSKWNSFWKSHPGSKYTFTHIVDTLIQKHGWTEIPCFVSWKEKRKYEYKVSK